MPIVNIFEDFRLEFIGIIKTRGTLITFASPYVKSPSNVVERQPHLNLSLRGLSKHFSRNV